MEFHVKYSPTKGQEQRQQTQRTDLWTQDEKEGQKLRE